MLRGSRIHFTSSCSLSCCIYSFLHILPSSSTDLLPTQLVSRREHLACQWRMILGATPRVLTTGFQVSCGIQLRQQLCGFCSTVKRSLDAPALVFCSLEYVHLENDTWNYATNHHSFVPQMQTLANYSLPLLTEFHHWVREGEE